MVAPRNAGCFLRLRCITLLLHFLIVPVQLPDDKFLTFALDVEHEKEKGDFHVFFLDLGGKQCKNSTSGKFRPYLIASAICDIIAMI